MKKIFLFCSFFLSLCIAAQKNNDVVNRAFLQAIKNGAVKIETKVSANIVIEKLQDFMKESKDSVFINDSKKFIDSLNLVDFKTIVVPVDLSKIDKRILKKFEVKEDKFDKSITIYPKWSINYIIYPHMFIKNNNMFFWLYSIYEGNSWIYMDKVKVLIDDKVYEYKLDDVYRNVHTNGANILYESSNIFITNEIMDMLRNISDTNSKIYIRFEGESFADRKINLQNKAAIKDMVTLYDELKNTKN